MLTHSSFKFYRDLPNGIHPRLNRKCKVLSTQAHDYMWWDRRLQIYAIYIYCNILYVGVLEVLTFSSLQFLKTKEKVCSRYQCFWGLVCVSSSNKREGTDTGQRSVCLNTEEPRQDVSYIRSTDPGSGTKSGFWSFRVLTDHDGVYQTD